MTSKKCPLSAKAIAEMRNYINDRFADVGDCDFRTLREVAHDALDKLIANDHLGASIGIDKLGAENARKMREKLCRLEVVLEPAHE